MSLSIPDISGLFLSRGQVRLRRRDGMAKSAAAATPCLAHFVRHLEIRAAEQGQPLAS